MRKTIPFAIVLIILAGINLNGQIDASNLICHYKFDDNAKDFSRYQNHGKIYGKVESAPNRYGTDCTAYKFDGSTGFIRIANNLALKKVTNTLSVTVWAKLSPNSCDRNWFSICCKADTQKEDFDSPHFRLQLSNNQASLNTYFTNAWSQNFIPSNWYFLAITVDQKYVKIYVNGVLAMKTPLDDKLETNGDDLLIGRDMAGSDEYFCGTMDDLRIYNKVLSSSEINKLYTDDSEQDLDGPCFVPVAIIPPPPPVHIQDTVRSVVQVEVKDTVRNVVQVQVQDTVRNVVKVQVQDTVRNVVQVQVQDTIRNVIEVQDTVRNKVNDEYSELPSEIEGAPIKYQQVVKVNSSSIKITPYDDRKLDGDIVSININGVWVKNKYSLKDRSKVTSKDLIFCSLNPGENNYLISKAWNLGRIPDNTLAIDIDDGVNPPIKVKIYSKIGLSGGLKIIYEPKKK